MDEIKGTEIPDEQLEGIAGGNAYIPLSVNELRDVMARAKRMGYTKKGFLDNVDPSFSWYDECRQIINLEWDMV